MLAKALPLEPVDAVVEDVRRGRVRFGILPFETTSDGAVTATLQALLHADVRITGELTLAATYHLMSATGNANDVEKVFGATAAVAACEKQLRRLHPSAAIVDSPSGVVAAELAKEDHGAAVVGPDFLAKEFGLHVVHERIEDVAGVDIRFAVIGNDHPPRTGIDRTVLAVAVTDEPGALYRSLKSFADRSINLTRVESRPGRNTPWRYVFFLELDGHITDRVVLTAVEELRSTSPLVKVLGSYPRPS
ncbi:MAG: prephenate dehydratase domain-containing protein [Polyangiales bacterium]